MNVMNKYKAAPLNLKWRRFISTTLLMLSAWEWNHYATYLPHLPPSSERLFQQVTCAGSWIVHYSHVWLSLNWVLKTSVCVMYCSSADVICRSCGADGGAAIWKVINSVLYNRATKTLDHHERNEPNIFFVANNIWTKTSIKWNCQLNRGFQ